MAKTNIKNIRANEVAQQNEEALKAARQAELDAIVEKDAFSTIPEVHNGSICSYEAEGLENEANNPNFAGIRAIIKGGDKPAELAFINGEPVVASTKEDLEVLKAQYAKGITGDRRYKQVVVINGIPCLCTGETPEDLEEDKKRAEEAAAAHKEHMVFDVTKAEDLDYSGYTEKDGKQIVVHDRTCFYIFAEKRIVNPEDYSTYVDINDVKKESGLKEARVDELDRDEIEAQLVKILDGRFLKEDLEAAAAAAENDGDYDEGYDDGYDAGYDDGYDDGRDEADY